MVLRVAVVALLVGCSSSDDPIPDQGPADSAVFEAAVSDLGADHSPEADSGGALLEQVVVDHAAGLPVGIDLLTYDEMQFVAYYNGKRQMTVASRKLGDSTWTRKVLPSTLPWDVHNSVMIAIDDNEDLHLAGNMHGDPLNYYRTTTARDITTLTKQATMVGTGEKSVTYPLFFTGPKGELLFRYRQGVSGAGVNYYNVYNPKPKTWKRLLDTPILSAPNSSAYDHGPYLLGGVYHLGWMWRDSSSQSLHDPSYARSPDLLNWFKADGTPITLPINMTSGDLVEAVPNKSGMVTYVMGVGIDTQKRPIVSYIKYDAKGDTQLYNGRFENGAWKIYQTSSWTGHWDADPVVGGAKIFIEPVRVESDGGLSQGFRHWLESPDGWTKWRLDEATLKPIGTYPHPKDAIPKETFVVQSTHTGMRVATLFGRGDKPEHKRYFLRWEVCDSCKGVWPPPGELTVNLLPP